MPSVSTDFSRNVQADSHVTEFPKGIALRGVSTSRGTTLASIATTMASGDGDILFDMTRGRVQTMSLKSETSITESMIGAGGKRIEIQLRPRILLTMELLDK